MSSASKDELPKLSVPVVLDESATLPIRGSDEAAGYDLAASESVEVPPRSRVVVNTGVKMAIGNDSMKALFPSSIFTVHGHIRGRSGLSKKGIEVHAGTIDADYRGEIKVIVINNTDEAFSISKGDRIAQMVFQLTLLPALIAVEQQQSQEELLSVTQRGEGGFGSTGVRAEEAVSSNPEKNIEAL